EEPMRTVFAIVLAASTASSFSLASKIAMADDDVAGVPERETLIGHLHPGPEVEGYFGSGFTNPYNYGAGARLGYTTNQGIYLGGAVEHFVGQELAGNPHITYAGGETGLKLFPTSRLEIRPYGFVGAAFPGSGSPQLAMHPGVIGAYHFGRGFIDVD